jgi:hypothetical protein
MLLASIQFLFDYKKHCQFDSSVEASGSDLIRFKLDGIEIVIAAIYMLGFQMVHLTKPGSFFCIQGSKQHGFA